MVCEMRWVLFFFLLFGFAKCQVNLRDMVNGAEEDPEAIANSTYSERQTNLHRQILKNYNRRIKPMINQSLPIDVKIHMYIMHYSVNEVEQTILVSGYIYMTWYDEVAVWDPADFNNIRTTLVKQWELWQPDLKVANSVAGVNQYFEISKQSHATLDYITSTKSKVQVYPTFNMKIGCHFDYSEYPRDVQSCVLRLYPLARMNEVIISAYNEYNPSIALGWGDVATNKLVGDWRLSGASNNVAYYYKRKFSDKKPVGASEAAKTWTVLMVTLVVERSAALYWVAMGIPAVSCALMNVLTFTLYNAEHAVVMSLCNFLIQIIYLQDFFRVLPPAVGNVPRIVTFSNMLICTTMLALILHLTAKQLDARKAKLEEKHCQRLRPIVIVVKTKFHRLLSLDEVDPSAETELYELSTLIRTLAFTVYCVITVVFVIFYL